MTQGYGEAAPLYWKQGWTGILPLPHRQKTPPPNGWTGYSGEYPKYADVHAWTEQYPDGNIGLRLPPSVVGVDVDFYDGKQGGRTLAHAESLWGELPSTVRSTSRIDGVSGIRLYLVDEGVELETVLRFPDRGLADIEVCQFFHRYAVCWPSVHPNGRTYEWLTAQGTPTGIPRASQLPRLPARWVEGLQRKPQSAITASADIDQVLKTLPGGPMTPRVQKELAEGLADLKNGGSRHDATTRHVLALFRFSEQGTEGGIREALGKLERAFIEATTTDGSRTRESAQGEWDRMILNRRGHDLIASTPSGLSLEQMIGRKLSEPPAHTEPPAAAKKEALFVEWQAEPQFEQTDFQEEVINEWMDPADDLVFEDDRNSYRNPVTNDEPIDPADALLWDDRPEPTKTGVTEFSTSWGLFDLKAAFDAGFELENPEMLTRTDGKKLFYRSKVNCLAGEPESGKSWVAMHTAMQVMEAGESVLYLDFEDSPRSILGRFVALGATRELMETRFGYSQPDMNPNIEEGAWDELQRVLHGGTSIGKPSLIVLDGWNAAMTLLGLNLEKNNEATQFHQLLLGPLSRTGATIVAIDHVTKSKDSRGSFAIGAQAKKAMIDGAMFTVECVEQFGRGRLGKLELLVQKDKPGGVREFAEKRRRGFYAGSVIVDATKEGSVLMKVVVEEEGASDNISKGHSQLIIDMIAVSNYLDREDPEREGLSGNKIWDGIPEVGKEKKIRPALEQLILLGRVEVVPGPRGAKLHVLRRAYAGPEVSANSMVFGSAGEQD